MTTIQCNSVLVLMLALATAPALAGGPVAIQSEGAILRNWRPVGSLPLPPYPPSLGDQGEDACVNLGYFLDKDGRTSNFVLLKAWGSNTPDDARGQQRLGVFAQSAAAALGLWRFTRAEGRGGRHVPVFTSATFAFSANPAADRRALRDRCRIADLRDFVDRALARGYARGNLVRQRMESHQQHYPRMITHHVPRVR